jgi:eukaryotic-like serine/threonine-protein kinase
MGLKFLQLFQPTNPDKPLGGRYEIQSQLGAGGFGQTFLAQDLHLPGHPQCVVKQLKPQATDTSSLETARRLFDIEAQVLYALGNHNQIPRLLAHFEDNQEFYLAQELIEGELLTQELIGGNPWSEIQVIKLLDDILQVLAFVHQQQVIHRDIKPSNLIRRQEDGKIVLIDFGAVKQVSTQVINRKTEQTKTISIGTQGYTPKEQLGGNPRFSSDIYALGIVGIQALTGIHPKRLVEDSETGEINWRDHAPQVSPELAIILDRMVRYDFRVRYQTATEALLALQTLPIQERPDYTSASTAIAPEVTPKQNLPNNSSVIGKESSLEPATDVWISTEPPQPSKSQSTKGSVASAHPTPTANSGLLPAEYSLPKQTEASWQKRFLMPFSLLTILGVGASVLISKTVLAPNVGKQAISNTQAAVQSPPLNPVVPSVSSSSVTPTPKPSATASIATKPTSTASPTSGNVGKSATPSPSTPVAVATGTTPSSSTEAAPSDLLSKADNLRQSGQYQKSVKLYEQVIANKPTAEAHWGRCFGLNALQQPEEAIASCNAALALNPNYPEALWSKGNALDQQQRPAESLKLYQQATALKPDFAEAWNNQGVALLQVGRTTEAIAALDKATTIKPNFADAWANRGAALWQLGRVRLAIASMEKALQIDPSNQAAANLRQQAREKLKR